MTSPGQLIDCHSDLMVDVFRRRRHGERDVLRRLHLPGMRAGGVVACVCTCGGDVPALQPLPDADPYTNTVAVLEELQADARESDGRVAVAMSTEQLARCMDEGVFALVPAIEGASPIQGDLARLADLYDRGIRVVGLTWNSRNELAVGLDAGEGGLTPLGVRAVEAMNRHGIVIDLAHAALATFWDVARETSSPLVVSHANAKAVWDHPRNLDDRQLDAVGESSGIVGLTLYPSFVGSQPVTLDNVLQHADYLIDRIGIESVAVGADFIDYAVDEILRDLRRHGDLYPEGSFTYPEGLETASGLPTLFGGLEARALGDGALRMLGVTNFLRVFEHTERLSGKTMVGS
jgi:membrane dipeptidase